MSQFDYYLVIILLGAGNLALALIAYRQRAKQIQGNALRETQVELAELRNDMAGQRVEYQRAQVELLEDIRAALVDGDVDVVTNGRPSSPRATHPQPARRFRRSSRPPRAPA
ncbi:MAG TPA: hypothetical protein VLB81_15815 [Gaiellales bacterium]|nr:hypothetical protein [Gaiellales bacterium]